MDLHVRYGSDSSDVAINTCKENTFYQNPSIPKVMIRDYPNGTLTYGIAESVTHAPTNIHQTFTVYDKVPYNHYTYCKYDTLQQSVVEGMGNVPLGMIRSEGTATNVSFDPDISYIYTSSHWSTANTHISIRYGTGANDVGELATYTQANFDYDAVSKSDPVQVEDFYYSKADNDYIYNLTDNWGPSNNTKQTYVGLNEYKTQTYGKCYTFDYNTTTTANALYEKNATSPWGIKTDYCPYTLSRANVGNVLDNSITVTFSADKHAFDNSGSTYYCPWSLTSTNVNAKLYTSDPIVNSDLITSPLDNVVISESLTAGTYQRTYTRLWTEALNKGEELTCEWHTNVATSKPSTFRIKFSQSISDANVTVTRTSWSLTIDENGNMLDYASAERGTMSFTKSRTFSLYYGYATRATYASSQLYVPSNAVSKVIGSIEQTLPFGIVETDNMFQTLRTGGSGKEYTTLTIISNYSDYSMPSPTPNNGLQLEGRLYWSQDFTGDHNHNRIMFLTNASYGAELDPSVGNALQGRSETMGYYCRFVNNTTTITGYLPQRYYEQYAVNFTKSYGYMPAISKYTNSVSIPYWNVTDVKPYLSDWANGKGANNDVTVTSTIFDSATDGLFVNSLSYGQNNSNYPWGVFIDCGTSTFVDINIQMLKSEAYVVNTNISMRKPSWENREVTAVPRALNQYNYLNLWPEDVGLATTSDYISEYFGFTTNLGYYGTGYEIGNLTTTTRVYSCTENKYKTSQTLYTSSQPISYTVTDAQELYDHSYTPLDTVSSIETDSVTLHTTYQDCNNIGFTATVPQTVTDTGSLYCCGTQDDGQGNFATGNYCNSIFNDYSTAYVMTRMNAFSTNDNNKFVVEFGVNVNGKEYAEGLKADKSDWDVNKKVSDVFPTFFYDHTLGQELLNDNVPLNAWVDFEDIFSTKAISDIDVNIPRMPLAVSYTIPTSTDYNNVQWKEGTANVYYAHSTEQHVSNKTWSGNIKYETYSRSTTI